MENKEKIHSIYRELKGYLSQTSQSKDVADGTSSSVVWERVNGAISELEEVSSMDYSRFKINSARRTFVRIIDIRMALGGIISKLHSEYFSEEDEPFGSKPSFVMNQSQKQEQHQETYIQMVVELATTIGQKLQDTNLKPEEKSFLEKIKVGISKAKTGIELINLILSTGSALNLTVDTIQALLK